MLIVEMDFDEALQQATAKAKQMVGNGLYSRFQLSYTQRVDKALLGCMGEFAFETLLKQHNINYELDTSDFVNTHSDEFDFKVNTKKIDIKVALKSTTNPPNDRWTYGYPQEQNPQNKDFVVVGWVDFANKQVGFYGWITGKQIAQYAVVTQNSFAKYRYLTPNYEFKWGDLDKNIAHIWATNV
ncbi:MAG: hypothetical protein JNM36_12410 [Chitinophagales bacterium]|nr:hypothetical protein [Chitinophagales bacterium]